MNHPSTPSRITLEAAIDLFHSAENHVTGRMIPIPKLKALARERYGKADETALDVAAAQVLLVLARAFITNCGVEE